MLKLSKVQGWGSLLLLSSHRGEYFGCGGDQPAQPSGTPADHHCPTTCTFHFLNQESCVPEVEVSTQNGSYTSIYSRRFRHNDP
ncbi:hypothetical protein T4B_10549 [Trichinella pseudospiralis]|uniref:Uncharacterized protein n=1 Tax=Trichinella pseudospiralis TaxID=6337 RepID=A0A0V1H4P4_TRIPS|nr:hypothetical protein T4B_10549 [Trichinella pseudospiralis]